MSEKTITLKMRPWNLRYLREHQTEGGFQNYLNKLRSKMEADAADQMIEVTFTEQELGELVRMMGYGQGGFQGMLRKVFTPAILKQIGYE